MSKNTYESAVLINAALDDDQIQAQVSRIKEAIISNEGEIKEVEDWGRKRLAYPINKSKLGYYVFYRYKAENTTVSKLERMFNLDEQILRYLTIKLDDVALEYLEKKQKDAALKLEEEEITEASDDEQDDESDDEEKE